MSHLPPDPPLDGRPSYEPERKASSASVLSAPRFPVTRWNRKYLMAGAAVLASIVAGGFYLGFGGAHATKGQPDDTQNAADTSSPQTPEIATRYAAGYADPAVRRIGLRALQLVQALQPEPVMPQRRAQASQ